MNQELILRFIADDPLVLGLGDLLLIEKIHDDAEISWKGLLLQDLGGMKCYQIQLQLGDLAEVRIIRAIEYRDIECKRSPQYQHIPVVMVEGILARLLNVLNLICQTIPFVVIQLSVLEFGGEVGLHFSTVIDYSSCGNINAEAQLNAVVDRFYWERKSSKKILDLLDRYCEIARRFDPEFVLEFTQGHIALIDGELSGFMSFRPCGDSLKMYLVIERSPGLERIFESEGVDLIYCSVLSRYSVNPGVEELYKMSDLIFEILKKAYRVA